jgi:hypothetical protein
MSVKRLTIISIVVIFGILGFIIWSNSYLHNQGYIEIRVNYGQDYHSYWTKEFSEDNGCISFVDESKRQQKICGSYQIIK